MKIFDECRETETDKLEKSTKEMEMRLKELQERLQKQKAETEKSINQMMNGGTKWKSSRPELGNLYLIVIQYPQQMIQPDYDAQELYGSMGKMSPISSKRNSLVQALILRH